MPPSNLKVRIKLDALRGLLSRSNRSQNHWALRLGLSRGHWSQVVNGHYQYPSPGTRRRILEEFGVEFDVLFETVPDREGDVGFQSAIADRYLVDSIVGEGGMGLVYRARDLKHGRTVALKAVAPESVDTIGVNQFLTEIRRASRFAHPNILPLLDSGEAAGHPFYVMPLVRGGSLRDLINAGVPRNPDDILRLIGGVCDALSYAHARSVLHCDVKPENVLLFGFHPWMTDFGIARIIRPDSLEWLGDRSTPSVTSAGTPGYVSPEQAAGDPELDVRSDIYSVACVAYELLAGVPPFEGGTTQEIVARRFVDKPVALREIAPQVSRRTAAVVEAALEIDPDRRPDSAAAFLEEFRQSFHVGLFPAVRGTASRAANRIRQPFARRRRGSGGVLASLERTAQDLSFAMRQVRRAPVFAFTAILTLALGIGMTTAVASLVYGVLIKPLPFPEPEHLLQVFTVIPDANGGPGRQAQWSFPKFQLLRDNQNTLTDLTAVGSHSYAVRGFGPPRIAVAETVESRYFSFFGHRPFIGRFLTPEEATGTAGKAVVLGFEFWLNWFGGDSAAVGRNLDLDGESFEVIGVMEPTARGLRREADLWVGISEIGSAFTGSASHSLIGIARRAPGRSLTEIAADLEIQMALVNRQYPQAGPTWGITATPLNLARVGDSQRTALWLLMGAVTFTLLIASLNLANLMAARGVSRRVEIAVRQAIGAGRRRMFSQLLGESLLLAIAGGTIGVASSWLVLRFFRQTMIASFGNAVGGDGGLGVIALAGVGVNPVVLAFALAVTLGAGLMFGFLPAWKNSRTSIADLMKSGSVALPSGQPRWGSSGISVQLALAVVLLAGASLMIRSLSRSVNRDMGFARRETYALSVYLPFERYQGQALQFIESYLAALEPIPGVESVAYGYCTPTGGGCSFSRAWRPDRGGYQPGVSPSVQVMPVSESFFATLGIRVARGRGIEAGDVDGAEQVGVLSENAVRTLFPGENPIGQQIAIGAQGLRDGVRVVGVVPDVIYGNLDQEPRPAVYVSVKQNPDYGGVFFVNYDGESDFTPLARNALSQLDPRLPISRSATINELVFQQTTRERVLSILLAALAVTGVLLSAVGLYGVTAWEVGRRTKEFGIRMALGSRAEHIYRIVLGRVLAKAGAGLMLGLIAWFALARLVQSQLFGIDQWDPVTIGVAGLALVAVAGTAGILPARRATRIEPASVLRDN